MYKQPKSLLLLVFIILFTASAFASGERMRQCMSILNMRGDLHEADISSELDPLFVHVGLMARDKGERVFNGSPQFFLFRPAHEGGVVSFKIVCARKQDRDFYGGRFKFQFGELKSVHYDAIIEKVKYGGYLFDAEAKPAFRLIRGAELTVSFEVPPLLEAIAIKATVPGGGAFFIRDLKFSGQAIRKRKVTPKNVTMDDVTATIKKATARATKAEKKKPVKKSAAKTEPSYESNDALTKKVKKIIKKLDAALTTIEGHLSRAERKKSGHPGFLKAIRDDVKKFEDIKKELEKSVENPQGYDW